jgi:hypothetical protein
VALWVLYPLEYKRLIAVVVHQDDDRCIGLPRPTRTEVSDVANAVVITLTQSSISSFIHEGKENPYAEPRYPFGRYCHRHWHCEAKAEAFADILKMGRTENQDAVPMTLGQEFGAYAVMIGSAMRSLRKAAADLRWCWAESRS